MNAELENKLNEVATDMSVREQGRKPTVVAVSGGFDPLHKGHIEYLFRAKQLGDCLVVILNSDEFLTRKKGKPFMDYHERAIILSAIKWIDHVFPCLDKDQTVCETLRVLKPTIFAKGGDRHAGEIPEARICRELGIKIVDGLGEKVQSSSWLLQKN